MTAAYGALATIAFFLIGWIDYNRPSHEILFVSHCIAFVACVALSALIFWGPQQDASTVLATTNALVVFFGCVLGVAVGGCAKKRFLHRASRKNRRLP